MIFSCPRELRVSLAFLTGTSLRREGATRWVGSVAIGSKGDRPDPCVSLNVKYDASSDSFSRLYEWNAA
jgi:hypothetical protein